jgi:hypothetical protein
MVEESGHESHPMRRVIVCGGRTFGTQLSNESDTVRADAEKALMDKTLSDFILPGDVIVQGGAKGADLLAALWAQQHGLVYETFMAKWSLYGAFAGHERNRRMLDSGTTFVVAFPGGRGTSNMVEIAKEAGLPVIEIDPI